MKTTSYFLLLLGLLCGFNTAHAQNPQPFSAPNPDAYQYSDYRAEADQRLLDLNKTPVRSKVLYDRVYPSARLFEWSASEASSYWHFVQAQAELYEASYNSHTKNFLPFTK